nr:nitroreductase family deazaflavin-dependent oxidoreductase [Mycobacteroides abscessus]
MELLAKGLENSHRAIWKISRGRLGQRAFGMQSLELHTIGRKSGRRHSTILTAPICAPDRLVLVASKGGSSSHPDWYKNLAVNPLVEITIEGQTYPYATRTATSQEKSQLWPLIIRAFPGYQGYQQNTARDIPLVICVPN